MRIGLLARMDNTGVGVQTHEFYKNMKPDKTLVIDMTGVNQHMGKVTKNYPDRYPEKAVFVYGFPTDSDFDSFLKDLDVVFTVESPYGYQLYSMARERDIKTVNQYNYEFLDYFLRPDWVYPDMLAAPTTWKIDEVRQKFGDKTLVKYLTAPVNRKLLPFKKRTQAKKFLHIAGYKTFDDRNGTQTVFEAIKLVKNKDLEFIIYSQHPLPELGQYNVKVINSDVDNYWSLYQDEDVLLLPRKYGGLSLQLNEALSCGMIPLMTDITPQNQYLKSASLIKYNSVKTIFTRMKMESYQCSPHDLADRIELLAQTPSLVQELSDYSNELADKISWENQIPLYLKEFEDLCLKS